MDVEYFVKRTDERLSNIESKLDQLIGFRWMLLGAAAVVSAIAGILVNLLLK